MRSPGRRGGEGGLGPGAWSVAAVGTDAAVPWRKEPDCPPLASSALRLRPQILPRPMLLLEHEVRLDRLLDTLPLVGRRLADDSPRHAHDQGIGRDLEPLPADGPGRD